MAAIAGVSTATVSRVINNEGKIRPSTREKVLDAVEKSGYRVNTIARSLKTSRSRIIGLITPEIANDFFMNIARGIEKYLKEFSYSLLISNSSESPLEERRRAELMVEKCVDGVIIIPSSDSGAHFSILREAGIPLVLADRLTPDYPADAVLVDNRRGTFAAISHLIKEGHTKIAYIGGSPELSNARERYEGYLHALGEYGIERDDTIILTGNFHVDSGYALMKRLMDLSKPPGQVFIANYFMYTGAVKYLIKNGFKPADSPKIGSFDDMELSSIFGYTSVTVSQPTQEIGLKAAELLLGRIDEAVNLPESGDSEKRGYRVIRLKTKLMTVH